MISTSTPTWPVSYREFLEKLRETPRRWHLTRGEKIRATRYPGWVREICPLEAVFGVMYTTQLDASTRDHILIAADNVQHRYRWREGQPCATIRSDLLKKIRSDLLEATGLTE